MEIKIPTSVRYVKNGPGGRWWQTAKTNHQIHLGWKSVPPDLLLRPDFSRIEQALKEGGKSQQGETQALNALRNVLNAPSNHVWVTFEDGYLWWCTVLDGANVNPDGEGKGKGHFWLCCEQPWSNKSFKGKPLAVADLPGTVTTVSGFKGTICTPKAWQTILRIIQDQKDADVMKAADARGEYERAVLKMVQRLSPKDFEQLIDHILVRTGWTRISKLGGVSEGIDIEAENLAVGEIAFVQVKSSANQQVLDDYIERFNQRRDFYARMIFAVHSPIGQLNAPFNSDGVQVWTGERVAQLVVRLGLGEWVESRLA